MGKYKVLLIILLVFLLTRIGTLFISIDKVFFPDELHQGMIAKEIMNKGGLSVFDYPNNDYHGGLLVSGLLTIPFFALFGPNLFALKLTPLLFSTLTLLVLFLFAWKFFNRRIALITALLYIFSPNMWITYSLYNSGSHSENILFTILAM